MASLMHAEMRLSIDQTLEARCVASSRHSGKEHSGVLG